MSGFAAFCRATAVSRETGERLLAYEALLIKWQARINLIGPATLPALWTRHMLDSTQLAALRPPGPLLDMGSGAGFPGLVLAILGAEAAPCHLVEADARKCAFLQEVVRVTGANAVIHHTRMEKLAPFPVATITARALAPLGKLLDLAEAFLTPGALCLFLKGRTADEELTQAGKTWTMTAERIASLTDPASVILSLKEVRRG